MDVLVAAGGGKAPEAAPPELLLAGAPEGVSLAAGVPVGIAVGAPANRTSAIRSRPEQPSPTYAQTPQAVAAARACGSRGRRGCRDVAGKVDKLGIEELWVVEVRGVAAVGHEDGFKVGEHGSELWHVVEEAGAVVGAIERAHLRWRLGISSELAAPRFDDCAHLGTPGRVLGLRDVGMQRPLHSRVCVGAAASLHPNQHAGALTCDWFLCALLAGVSASTQVSAP